MSVSVSASTLNTVLNGFFEDNSFVSGAEATTADVELFKSLSGAPNAKALPHFARWYKNIASNVDSITAKPAEAPASKEEEDDDDIDLFGSDDDEVDEELEKQKAQRLEEYRARKAAKGPGPVAKSMVTYDIKPWEAETDLAEVEELVKGITLDGLTWAKKGIQVPIGYGIKKLQINATVEDAKVSTEDLKDKIEEDFSDYVQSVDIAAFMKL
ncbi:Translation elongation factor 1 beta [Coemansia sp. RSA 1813]|nr:Translation elongation factor 1 beta [Coemansia sp. RSA 1646]KAJ1770093.1 Translation elongation factor 1 beta [Coemansia sp. RSA 1843]KAJ2089869.1 Translation elongation factor 1 beta [Coemansia sp. RSA 986]KAJ2214746.1 Translation elongation factor 1 beta [Coemansia sp. RSA 487]KAJ2569733.1 Translation elongation factor 1 beta [Coemansia sp. RSA 1813]